MVDVMARERAVSDLVEFLLARITERKKVALAATPGPWRVGDGERNVYECGENSNSAVAVGPYGSGVGDSADHIALNDPSYVLTDCEAKHNIVRRAAMLIDSFERTVRGQDGAAWPDVNRREKSQAWNTLYELALPHADHPDYRPEWQV